MKVEQTQKGKFCRESICPTSTQKVKIRSDSLTLNINHTNQVNVNYINIYTNPNSHGETMNKRGKRVCETKKKKRKDEIKPTQFIKNHKVRYWSRPKSGYGEDKKEVTNEFSRCYEQGLSSTKQNSFIMRKTYVTVSEEKRD